MVTPLFVSMVDHQVCYHSDQDLWSRLVPQTLDRTQVFFFLNPSHLTLGSGDRLPKGVKKESLEGNRTPPEQWNLNCTLVFQCFFFLFVCMTEKVTWLRNLKFSQVGFQRFSILFQPEYWRGPRSRTDVRSVSSLSLTHHGYVSSRFASSSWPCNITS